MLDFYPTIDRVHLLYNGVPVVSFDGARHSQKQGLFKARCSLMEEQKQGSIQITENGFVVKISR